MKSRLCGCSHGVNSLVAWHGTARRGTARHGISLVAPIPLRTSIYASMLVVVLLLLLLLLLLLMAHFAGPAPAPAPAPAPSRPISTVIKPIATRMPPTTLPK